MLGWVRELRSCPTADLPFMFQLEICTDNRVAGMLREIGRRAEYGGMTGYG